MCRYLNEEYGWVWGCCEGDEPSWWLGAGGKLKGVCWGCYGAVPTGNHQMYMVPTH